MNQFLAALLLAAAAHAEPLVLAGGRLVDGFGGPPLENAVIVIDGNRIKAVGAEGTVAKFRWVVNGPEDARKKVQTIVAGGADVIKMIDQDQMTLEEVKAIVDEAHKNGKPVVAHSRRIPMLAAKFRQLREAGVTILVGTDSGIPLNFHFDSTWRELKTMVDLGMPPMDAIRAATYWPAQFLKQPDLGTVAVGKLADVIVVDGDPLTDMTSMRHIVHVVKDGRVYK